MPLISAVSGFKSAMATQTDKQKNHKKRLLENEDGLLMSCYFRKSLVSKLSLMQSFV